MLDLIFNNFTADRKYGEKFFIKILNLAKKETVPESKIELSVNLVGEGRIRILNKKYRGKNKVTDVLSFPLQEHLSDRVDGKLAGSGIIPLGDVFICLPVAKKYARREGVGLDSKMAFLVVHGFLHLLGYDHETVSDQEMMFKLQDDILSKLKP